MRVYGAWEAGALCIEGGCNPWCPLHLHKPRSELELSKCEDTPRTPDQPFQTVSLELGKTTSGAVRDVQSIEKK